jgi:hypothetical protein
MPFPAHFGQARTRHERSPSPAMIGNEGFDRRLCREIKQAFDITRTLVNDLTIQIIQTSPGAITCP